jgi:hypothetical protein
MTRFALLFCLFAATSARADVTTVDQGLWEIDLGGLAVLTSDREGDSSVTRMSSDMSASVSYFVIDNVSVGASMLADYENVGGGVSATTYGADLHAALHLRLGLGAFFRPGLGLGGLFGTRHLPTTPGMIEEAQQAGMIARLQLPIAYFASERILLQAGPQLNFTAGSYTPGSGMSMSFTRIAGGFAVGVGYAF